MAEVDTRAPEDQIAFRRYMASRHFVNAATDPEGLGDIANYTAELLQA